MRIVRSNFAHGKLRAIDAEAALALPGVHAAWTAPDIVDMPPIDFREGPIEKLAPFRQPVWRGRFVRYVGEPVAAVFATDPYLAEDAAELVASTLRNCRSLRCLGARRRFRQRSDDRADDMPPGLRRRRCRLPQLRPHRRNRCRHRPPFRRRRSKRAARSAATTPRATFSNFMAPPRSRTERESLARMFGRSTAAVHCYEGHVGGGFGVRGEIYPEDILVLRRGACAGPSGEMAGRSPRTHDRGQSLAPAAASHSRRGRREGHLLGIDDRFFYDQGAYIRTHGDGVAETAAGILPGPYRMPATAPMPISA